MTMKTDGGHYIKLNKTKATLKKWQNMLENNSSVK